MERKAPERQRFGPESSLVVRNGKKFTGKGKAMTNSQHYTPAYGQALADAYLAQRAATHESSA